MMKNQSQLRYQSAYLAEQLIVDLLANGAYHWLDEVCLYCPDSSELISKSTLIYLDEYPDEDEVGDDLFSAFVVDNNLELLCSGELFKDVLDNLQHQGAELSVESIIAAANFYLEHDNFISIND
ncbi:hypothetical protein [Celerinatantimonas sp. MCCC 1A17872]|uniref:DUF7716 domain-containing protein n=1 Tax=Celerinatantimonas sp. MCCC 1A17872 TaxID=3177514 RepID=UPI0038C4C733